MLTFGAMKEEEEKIEVEETEEVESKVYEAGLLIVPEVAEEKVPEIVSAIKVAIEGEGGFHISEGFPKLRPLSYTIIKKREHKRENYSQAYFGWLKFEVSPQRIANVKRFLTNDANILRFIIINTVRENTLYSQRITTQRKDKVYKKEETKKEEVSEEEIDKSIEELVAN